MVVAVSVGCGERYSYTFKPECSKAPNSLSSTVPFYWIQVLDF